MRPKAWIIHIYTQRGEFTPDITQLSNKPAVVDAYVDEDVDALLLRPDDLSAMIIREADIGEKIMRALILRRALAVERGRGLVIVGAAGNSRLLVLQDFDGSSCCPRPLPRHDNARAPVASCLPAH
ncbi:hypothetical protein [Cupriavidus consociatus]|uniref:hypothetical protein n=1 Tax=Cupriavidus consociatus TaxID=2821357 RepID=UPI003D75675E